MNIFKKLFSKEANFSGADYSEARDKKRLGRQAVKIFNYMHNNGWQSLNAIAKATGEPSPSISAQLRAFRNPKFQPDDAIYEVDKRYVSNGLYEYKLIVVPNDTMFKKVI